MHPGIIPKVDIDRVINALSINASDFGLNGSWLQHRPTKHRFKFAKDGRLILIMYYGIFLVWVSPEQRLRLSSAFAAWKLNYWSLRAAAGKRAALRRSQEYLDLRDSATVLTIIILSAGFLMAWNQVLEYYRSSPPASVAAAPLNPRN